MAEPAGEEPTPDPTNEDEADLARPNLYVAVMVSGTSSDAPDHEPLYEESFVLVSADTLDEAENKAIRLGIEDESSSVNEAGETIEWTLLHSVDVKEVVDGEIFDGATLYVRHFTDFEAYGALEPVVYAEAEAGEEEEASETPPGTPTSEPVPPATSTSSSAPASARPQTPSSRPGAEPRPRRPSSGPGPARAPGPAGPDSRPGSGGPGPGIR
ncbi:MAG: DUF4288 domain-containing protein [Solirubrobacterales bacterium]